MNPKKALEQTAKMHNVPEQYVHNEIQKALDVAWSTNDEAALKRQQELFPNGKPTMEELIKKISQIV